MDGFILVDKPLEFTSFDVIQKVRKHFGIRRVGHTGTLDPLATGLMVIGLGKATRFLEFHTGHDKVYEAEITFGAVSETYDAEGPITNIPCKTIERKVLEEALEHFRGEIEQIPPKYSALKINGEKLCNMVRAGKEVDVSIKKRKITVFSLELLEYSWPKLTLTIHCSSGTYIRSIAHDLGQALKCGGYLSALRRTKIENFSVKDACLLENLKDSTLLPFDAGLGFDSITLEESQIKKLQYGQKISLEKDVLETKIVKVFSQEKEFFGLAELKENILSPYKMLVI